MGSGASTNGSNGGAGLSVIPVPMHRENNGNLSSGDMVIRYASYLDAHKAAYMSKVESLSDSQTSLATALSHSCTFKEKKPQLVFKVSVALRHPTHNIPDQFHRRFYVDPQKGAVLQGSKFQSLRGIYLRDLEKNSFVDTDGVKRVTLNSEEGGGEEVCRYYLQENRAQAFSLCHLPAPQVNGGQSDGAYFIVPSPRFHADYSGITLLIGDRFLPTRVLQLKLGDMLKLGSSVLLVERVTLDLEEEGEPQQQGGEDKNKEHRIPEELSRDLLKACGGGSRGAVSAGGGVNVEGANNSMNRSGNLGSFVDNGMSINREASMNIPRRNSGEEDSTSEFKKSDDENDKKTSDENDDEIADDDPNAPPPPGACCYVCTDSESTPSDPLVAPCACKGGTKYVHITCLRQWATKDKVQGICTVIKENGDNCYVCSVCKTPYAYVRQGVKIFESDVEPPCLTLRVMVTADDEILAVGTRFHVSFESVLRQAMAEGRPARPLSIGRNSSNDIVLPCSSVSNYHAKLHYYDKRLFVTDNQSSNGTHIHLREPLEIARGSPTTVRLGRSTVTINLQEQMKARLDPTTYFLKTNNSSMIGRMTKEVEFNQQETNEVLDCLQKSSDKGSKNQDCFAVNRAQLGYLYDLMISMTPKLSPAHLNCLEAIRIANGWHEQKLTDFAEDEKEEEIEGGAVDETLRDDADGGGGGGGEADAADARARSRAMTMRDHELEDAHAGVLGRLQGRGGVGEGGGVGGYAEIEETRVDEGEEGGEEKTAED